MSDPFDIAGTIKTLSEVSDRLNTISKEMTANQNAITHLQNGINILQQGKYKHHNSLCAIRVGYPSESDTGVSMPIARTERSIRARIKLHEAALEYLKEINALYYEEVVTLREKL